MTPKLLALLLIPSIAIAACGQGHKPVAPAAGGDGGAPGGTGIFATSPPPSGLPPMAAMPPPGVAGSKKGKKKPDGSLLACGGNAASFAKDPADHVKRIGEGCAAASKMKPVGGPIRGQQADKDAHQEHKLKVEANKCYRIYFATDESAKDVVLVMRDSAGDVVVESPGPALPQDGAVCFTSADEVSLLLAIGSGKGAYAAQAWSN